MRVSTLLVPFWLVGVLAPQAASLAQGFRIEAEEDDLLGGFRLFVAGFFSAGAGIETQVTGAPVTATYIFPGWDGPYDISVGYCDENDGDSSYELRGNPAEPPLASWIANLASTSPNCAPETYKVREVATAVELEQGETLTLECVRAGNEPCRVDFLDFTYVGPMPPVGDRAFPGAVGFGALAAGARGLGAEICEVTTLADNGAGSFRACAEQAPPAYITFAVSGYIDLSDEVDIAANKTIECATAPGDGVVFRLSRLHVTGDNVILRGCRAWTSDEPGGDVDASRDAITVGNADDTVTQVVVANNSMMFGVDENGGTWFPVAGVAFQHNVIAWALAIEGDDDSKAMLISNGPSTVSVVENYFAFNFHRNPQIHSLAEPVEVVNNVIYCFGENGTQVNDASTRVHVIGNRFKKVCPPINTPEIKLRNASVGYAEDNARSDGSPAVVDPDASSEVSTVPLFSSTIVPVPSDEVEDRVFAKMGPPRLLAFDIAAFDHYASGTGGLVESVDDLGGWPTLQRGTPPTDSDGDGMPDEWEEAHCGGPCEPAGDADDDGYENIEEWFHSFYGDRVAVDLEVDVTPLVSDGNRVFEPGEQVEVAPSWRNREPATVSVSGTASSFSGPAGATYTVVDNTASYGSLGPGESGGCRDTGNCYRMSVNDPAVRPATHWHATFTETVPGGSPKLWTLHIGDSFSDVSRSSPFYPAIEAMLHHGVTSGCGGSQYCPAGAVPRGGMAVFLLKAKEGPAYVPPACVAGDELFGDVPAGNALCRWIEELARRGVVAGCGGGNYCPSSSVTRAQMAVFLLKTLEGGSYTPPMCSGLFTDVPCPSTFANWIEDLTGRGITGGCTATQYCPTASVTRDQMAVFLSRTFGLTLYGP